jgi:transposase
MGRHLEIEWEQSIEELKQLYKQEGHHQRRTRLQALWHLRSGKRIADVVEITGASYRSIQDWISWYRQGGLKEVLKRVAGHHAKGVEPYLNPVQQKALVAKVKLGEFTTVWDVMEWVQARWGVSYTYKGMYSLMKRHRLGLKVPRPHSEKASVLKQLAWKKGAY